LPFEARADVGPALIFPPLPEKAVFPQPRNLVEVINGGIPSFLTQKTRDIFLAGFFPAVRRGILGRYANKVLNDPAKPLSVSVDVFTNPLFDCLYLHIGIVSGSELWRT
jgi:hypothetical protein